MHVCVPDGSFTIHCVDDGGTFVPSMFLWKDFCARLWRRVSGSVWSIFKILCMSCMWVSKCIMWARKKKKKAHQIQVLFIIQQYITTKTKRDNLSSIYNTVYAQGLIAISINEKLDVFFWQKVIYSITVVADPCLAHFAVPTAVSGIVLLQIACHTLSCSSCIFQRTTLSMCSPFYPVPWNEMMWHTCWNTFQPFHCTTAACLAFVASRSLSQELLVQLP